MTSTHRLIDSPAKLAFGFVSSFSEFRNALASFGRKLGKLGMITGSCWPTFAQASEGRSHGDGDDWVRLVDSEMGTDLARPQVGSFRQGMGTIQIARVGDGFGLSRLSVLDTDPKSERTTTIGPRWVRLGTLALPWADRDRALGSFRFKANPLTIARGGHGFVSSRSRTARRFGLGSIGRVFRKFWGVERKHGSRNRAAKRVDGVRTEDTTNNIENPGQV